MNADTTAPTVEYRETLHGTRLYEYRKHRLSVRFHVKESRAFNWRVDRDVWYRTKRTVRRYILRWCKRRGYKTGDDVFMWFQEVNGQRELDAVCRAIIADQWSERITPKMIDDWDATVIVAVNPEDLPKTVANPQS